MRIKSDFLELLYLIPLEDFLFYKSNVEVVKNSNSNNKTLKKINSKDPLEEERYYKKVHKENTNILRTNLRPLVESL